MVSYREIEDRYNTQTDTQRGGYPERGPFGSEEEAWSAETPCRNGIVVRVYQDDRGWWAIFTPPITTTTLPEWADGFPVEV